MLEYFFKRLLALLPKLLIITTLIFIGLELVPGDSITRSVAPDILRRMTPEQIEFLREAKGLNDPMFIRYFRWLWDLLRGDFGYSAVTGSSIRSLMEARIPATVELSVAALIISTIAGLFLGFVSAIKQNTPIDYTNTVIGMIGISVPDFFFGMSFILIFAARLHWLPSGGRISVDGGGIMDRLQYLILPALCMGIMLIATLMRFTRNSMLDVMGKDYVKTARAKGLTKREIYTRHVLRNGSTPVMFILVGRLSFLVSGATVIETIFNYPGVGNLMIYSVQAKDIPVAMFILLLSSIAVLFTCFLSDILLAVLDPRIRFE